MRKAIIVAAAAGLLGFSGAGLQAARASAVQGYEGPVNAQPSTLPQGAQALAQAEGTSGGHTRYGQQAQAEGTSGGHTRYRQQAQAEGTGGSHAGYGQRFAAGEQTGVDNGAIART